MGKKSKKKIAPKKEPRAFHVSPRIIDLVVIMCLIGISLAWWWPHRYLPFWWDSAGFVINAVHDLYTKNFQPPIALHSDFAHPPLLMVLVAASWKLLGVSPLNAHLTTLPFLATLLISTYFLAKKLVTPTSAFLAATLVASVPIVLHETSQIYLDLPSAALSTLSLALLLNKRQVFAAITLTLAALTKETALIILPLFGFLSVSRQTFTTRAHRVATLALVALPLLAYLAYALLFHHYTTFWFSTRDGRLSEKFSSSASTLIASAQDVGTSFFIDNGMWFLSLTALIALGFIWRKQSVTIFKDKHWLGFLATVVAALSAYALFQEYTLRYSLMILPLWIIGVMQLVEKASEAQSPRHAQVIVVSVGITALVFFGLQWYPRMQVTNSYSFSPPTNLTALDRIFVFRQAAKYLELTHQGKQILGGFPENQQLTQTYLGYVDQALPFSLCDSESLKEFSQTHLLVFHPYSPVQMECKKLLETKQATLLNRFERNGSWVEVYELTGKKPEAADKLN